MLRRRSHIRRYVAAAALLGVGFGAFEPAVGLARDAAIHHEGAIEAAAHAATQNGEHGHEHALEGGAESDSHGPEHQHGTSADHCTHAHGAAMTTVMSGFSTVVESHRVDRLDPRLHDQTCADPLFHPPKA